jgi:Cu2+-containing amine oxidase
VQSEGPSFTVDGYEVAWQNWKFRIGFTPREGLVLHDVTYHDAGRQRPIVELRTEVAGVIVSDHPALVAARGHYAELYGIQASAYRT